MSVDDAAKTLTVHFPGANVGVYYFNIMGLVSGTRGSISSPQASITLTIKMEVTSYSPTTGSTLGGTLVTINGAHFGKVATDNPVKIGNHYCYVITTADTLITCRVADLSTQSAQSELLLVFARTTLEMDCRASDPDCKFAFADPTAIYSGITSTFDAATNSIEVTVQGTGFGTSTTGMELVIDGTSHAAKSATNTEVKFTLTNANDTTVNDIRFYTQAGNPQGYASLTTITFAPGLVSVSPSTGSSGGEKLTITGVGFGINSTSVNLYHVESSQNLCYFVEVTAYGTFTCYTIVQEVQTTDTLKLVVAGSQYNCLNTASAADCQY